MLQPSNVTIRANSFGKMLTTPRGYCGALDAAAIAGANVDEIFTTTYGATLPLDSS